MDPVLTLQDVRKHYADHVAVDSLSLAVPAGTIYGILGPNGAGKSTTLRMIMNIISRDGGEIELLGRDPARHRDVLKEVGYLPEERGLYRKMKVIDTIVFFAELKGVGRTEGRRLGRQWLERMGLAEWEGAKVETLSKGMQQKVQFITTVLHGPQVLVLDEPFSGLDPVNQDVLKETVFQAKAEGRTVLFSTHVMEQAERICDHLCIIAGGRNVLQGSIHEVRRQFAGDRYEVEFEHEPESFASLVADQAMFASARRQNGCWQVELASGVDTSQVLARVSALRSPIIRFARVEPTLHEIFVAKVGDANIARRRPDQAHE